jgi:hypothetical protein
MNLVKQIAKLSRELLEEKQEDLSPTYCLNCLGGAVDCAAGARGQPGVTRRTKGEEISTGECPPHPPSGYEIPPSLRPHGQALGRHRTKNSWLGTHCGAC